MSEKKESPLLLVVAGPNGAGKSTFFDLFLRQTGLPFVNADLIARAVSPEAPHLAAYAAAAAAEIERRALIERKQSFCMETVLSDPKGDKLRLLRDAKAAGFRIQLVFIGLGSVDLSEARVVQRVLVGGHDVPHEKLVARFPRTLANAREALRLADAAELFDNSDAEQPYRLVARLEGGRIAERVDVLPSWASSVLDSL